MGLSADELKHDFSYFLIQNILQENNQHIWTYHPIAVSMLTCTSRELTLQNQCCWGILSKALTKMWAEPGDPCLCFAPGQPYPLTQEPNGPQTLILLLFAEQSKKIKAAFTLMPSAPGRETFSVQHMVK